MCWSEDCVELRDSLFKVILPAKIILIKRNTWGYSFPTNVKFSYFFLSPVCFLVTFQNDICSNRNLFNTIVPSRKTNVYKIAKSCQKTQIIIQNVFLLWETKQVYIMQLTPTLSWWLLTGLVKNFIDTFFFDNFDC